MKKNLNIAKLYFVLRYVDSYRGISVQLGGPEIDLKEAIDLSGLTAFNATDNQVIISSTILLMTIPKSWTIL